MDDVLREAPCSGASAAMAFCYRAIASKRRGAQDTRNELAAGFGHQATEERRVRTLWP